MIIATPTHKTCTKCAQTMPLEDFYKQVRNKYGRASRCKQCSSFNAKLYYVNNYEKIQEHSLKYRTANPEKERERLRKYYAENREKEIERARKDRTENPEKFRERRRKYRTKNHEKVLEGWRRFYASNPEKMCARGRNYYSANHDKIRLRHRDQRLNLSNIYVRDCIVKGTSLSASDIPDELIELKRAHLQLGREIKNLKQRKVA